MKLSFFALRKPGNGAGTIGKYGCCALAFALVCCAGCNRGSIGERTLVKVLAEMHFVDALAAEHPKRDNVFFALPDSAALYAPIFERYETSAEQVRRALTAYTVNKDKVGALYEKVVKELEENERHYAEVQQRYYQSQDQWQGEDALRLWNEADSGRYPFSIPTGGRGNYIFSATVLMDTADRTPRPRIALWLYDERRDTVLRRVDRYVYPQPQATAYTLSLRNDDTLATHLRGYLLDRDAAAADTLPPLPRFVELTQIMLRFVPEE